MNFTKIKNVQQVFQRSIPLCSYLNFEFKDAKKRKNRKKLRLSCFDKFESNMRNQT